MQTGDKEARRQKRQRTKEEKERKGKEGRDRRRLSRLRDSGLCPMWTDTCDIERGHDPPRFAEVVPSDSSMPTASGLAVLAHC